MAMNASELLFEEYLRRQGISFSRDFPVNSHNVGFQLIKETQTILCDVKEVRDPEVKLDPSVEKIGGCFDAQDHIRGDIKKLRQKFNYPPLSPLILVSMNFSSTIFTALSVSRALMGEIGVIYDRDSGDVVFDLHHLHAGNASVTQKKNRSISGLLEFDVAGDNHCLFRSPYANYAVSPDFFSSIRVIDLQKNETPQTIIELSRTTFWHRNES